jgi:hypothetical protein
LGRLVEGQARRLLQQIHGVDDPLLVLVRHLGETGYDR